VKVTTVESFVVNGGDANLVFVKVSTDEGITGVGECTLESKELAVVGAIEECKRTLIGKNPLEIERIWVTRNRTFPWKGAVVFTAMSGLEHALWDITGKAYGQPVYRLLGGPVRDSVRAYTWPGPYDSPESLAEAAVKAREEYGFTAFKIDPFKDFVTIGKSELRYLERCMTALYDALGPDADVAVDGHWRFLAPAAIKIAKVLEPFDPFFLEEPTTSDNAEGLARLRNATHITLATGERHNTRWEVWPLLRERLVDVIQTDLCHAGGILEVRKIAAMAEACDVMVAPHNPNGPVSLAAVVHMAACTPNFLITEYVHTREAIYQRYVKEPLKIVDGHVQLPTAPGLGVELDEEAIAAHPPVLTEILNPHRIVV
jgi:galactonate dehydratase